MDSSVAPSTKPLYRGTQIVWYVLGIVETLLLFRFILKFLAANPAAGFTEFIYEWSTILAMMAYWVLAIAIIKLFLIGKSVSTPEAAVKLEEQEVKTTV
jgi:hypothetical protein